MTPARRRPRTARIAPPTASAKGGFIVRRPFPRKHGPGGSFPASRRDGPAAYGPARRSARPITASRFGPSLHAGGEFEHEDSAGHSGVLRPATCNGYRGAGIVIRMPSRHIREKGGRVHGFQTGEPACEAEDDAAPLPGGFADKIPEAKSETGARACA